MSRGVRGVSPTRKSVGRTIGSTARPRHAGGIGTLPTRGRLPMRPAAHYYLTTPATSATAASEADALFVSALQRSDELSAGQIRQAIAAAVGAFGYSGCAGRVAQEFGDHPETAAARMRWAR